MSRLTMVKSDNSYVNQIAKIIGENYDRIEILELQGIVCLTQAL